MIVLSNLLTSGRWDSMSTTRQEQIAARIEKALVPRVRFEQIETYRLDSVEHPVAIFASRRGKLALIPRYEGSLGYDPVRHSIPELHESKMASVGKEPNTTNDRENFQQYLNKVLTPLREVDLRPFLLATRATPLEITERQSNGILRNVGPVRRLDILASISREGFRFPTSDEWEYACSGGTRSLFRWGDTWPMISWTPPSLRGVAEWQEDLKPNTFGLEIGQDPWNLEYCAEEGTVRGGDGGAAASVHAGSIFEWLPLATPYRFPFRPALVENLMRSPYLRIALSLPNNLLQEPAE